MKKNLLAQFAFVLLLVSSLPVSAGEAGAELNDRLLEATNIVLDHIYEIRKLDQSQHFSGDGEVTGFCQLLGEYSFVDRIASGFANKISEGATKEQIARLIQLGKTSIAASMVFSFNNIESERDELKLEVLNATKGHVRVHLLKDEDLQADLFYAQSSVDGSVKLREAAMSGKNGSVKVVKLLQKEYVGIVRSAPRSSDRLQHLIDTATLSYQKNNRELCP